MSEQTIPAESSTATPVVEIDRGALVNLTADQRAEFRRTGELPAPPKKEESASSAAPEETATSEAEEATSAGESEPPKKSQENRRSSGAEDRIKQLLAKEKQANERAERAERALEEARRSNPQAQPEAPKPVAQPQANRPKPTLEDKTPDGKPKYSTYEDFQEDLTDWKVDQRLAAERQHQQLQQAQQRVSELRPKAAEQYSDFEEVAAPMADKVMALINDPKVNPLLKRTLLDPDGFHILYALGSDQELVDKFDKLAISDPDEAIFLWKSLKKDVKAAIAKPEKDKPATPAKPQTAALKPPSEVGGRAATPGDEMDAAAKANDFRRFKAEANRRDLARLKA